MFTPEFSLFQKKRQLSASIAVDSLLPLNQESFKIPCSIFSIRPRSISISVLRGHLLQGSYYLSCCRSIADIHSGLPLPRHFHILLHFKRLDAGEEKMIETTFFLFAFSFLYAPYAFNLSHSKIKAPSPTDSVPVPNKFKESSIVHDAMIQKCASILSRTVLHNHRESLPIHCSDSCSPTVIRLFIQRKIRYTAIRSSSTTPIFHSQP